MSFAPTFISFGAWLPDLPPFGNPGLTIAENAIPVDETYKSYAPLTVGATFTLLSNVRGTFSYAQLNPTSGAVTSGLIVGTDTTLRYDSALLQTFNSAGSGYTATDYWRFAQFDEQIIATNGVDLPQRFSIGAGAAVILGSSPGTAPAAQHVGVVGRFVVLGDIPGTDTGPYTLQWSGVDDYDSFPTPNSATAIAQQAGEQIMPADGGTITGITNGDQFSVIFQRARVSRMTYVGPPVVFQFDPIEVGRGCFYPNSVIQAKGLTYFASGLGFFVTDGVKVESISEGQTDSYFKSLLGNSPGRAVSAAVDYDNKCIMWAFHNSGKIVHYNYERKRWSYANETIDWLVNGLQRS